MTDKRHSLRRKLPALFTGVFLMLFTAGVVYGVKSFIDHADKPEKPKVQQISLVKPPPPRDLPKPPEPEKIEEEQPKEEVEIDTPPDPQEAQNNDSPPGENLAIEGEGGAGGDAFGLVGKKGVRDLTTLGQGGGDREAWYGRLIARHFEEQLRRSKRLQGSSYQVVAQIWFDHNGGVQRVQLARGSGSTETDAAIREELMVLPPLREALPEDMPQPVRIRVSSRS